MSTGISYQLANVEGMSLAEVDAVLSAGGRFVMFEFALSLFLVTYSSPSKVWLVRDEEDARRLAKRYTIPTLLLGWWGVPYGPIRTVEALRVNRGGGVDVTQDVRGALTEESARLGVVRFEEVTDIYRMFDPIDGSDLGEIRRYLGPILERHSGIDAAWAGRIADQKLQPIHRPYAICLEAALPLDDSFAEEARAALRRGFPKWVRFEFFDMADEEISKWVVTQCEPIYLRER